MGCPAQAADNVGVREVADVDCCICLQVVDFDCLQQTFAGCATATV
jgi:hypothetical protein